MKVIMLQNVKGVGQKDTIVDVADGFALNALIPQRKAAQATLLQIDLLQKKKAEREFEALNKTDTERKTIRKLAGVTVRMKAPANASGSLFKGITKDDIAAVLSTFAGALVERRSIQNVHAPIKEIGEYSLQLSSGGVESTMCLTVEAETKKK